PTRRSSDLHVMSLGHRSYFSRFGNAARMANVGLNDIHGSFSEKVQIEMTGEQSLTGRNGNTKRGDGAPNFEQRVRILGRHGLLEPARLKFRQPMTHIDRCMSREPPVHFDKKVNSISNGLTHRANDLNRLTLFLLGHLIGARAEWIDLHCSVPHLYDRFRAFGDRLGSAFYLIPAVGICTNSIAAFAAKQPPNRYAERLAQNIPARHFNTTERRANKKIPSPIFVAINAFPKCFNVSRVFADQKAFL